MERFGTVSAMLMYVDMMMHVRAAFLCGNSAIREE